MEVAEVTSFQQSGNGVAWTSLSNLSVKDSRYAFVTINGKSKNTNRPKNLVINEAKFNIDSYNPSIQDFFIEYKMYLDETSVPDGFTSLKRPDILITFFDNTTYEVLYLPWEDINSKSPIASLLVTSYNSYLGCLKKFLLSSYEEYLEFGYIILVHIKSSKISESSYSNLYFFLISLHNLVSSNLVLLLLPIFQNKYLYFHFHL